MKKTKTVKQAERLTFWIIIFGIAGLFLISLIPWISTTETQAVEGDLLFNLEMMLKSNNGVILEIANNLETVNFYLWTLITIGLISLIGGTIHTSGKINPVGKTLLLVGFGMLVCSFFVLDIQINTIKTINDTFFIKGAEIFPHFHFSYIFLIVSVIMLIFTALYIFFIVLHIIEKLKEYIDKKRGKDEQIDLEAFSQNPKDDENISALDLLLSQNTEKSNNLEAEKQVSNQIEKSDLKDEKETPIIPIEEEKPEEKIEKQNEIKKDKKVEESKDGDIKESFDKALSSLIEKEDLKKEKIESDDEEDSKTKIKVRCPQCREIFLVDDRSLDIVCPRCGKEGKIKIKNNKKL